MDKQLLLLEINEFEPSYLKKVADRFDLKNIKTMLGFSCVETEAFDENEHNGLDPWVQWVSIHTGLSSQQHNILRLGQVDQLTEQQIWEKLSDEGITSGVWGAMNAVKGDAEKCLFFLPDPWVYQEQGYPDEINDLLELPRHFSKNYLDPEYIKLFKGLARLFWFSIKTGLILDLLKVTPHILKGFYRLKFKSSFLFATFDLLNVVAFLKYKKNYSPNLTILFLNSIAHFQHNYWSDEIDEHAEYVFSSMDIILGLLFKNINTDDIWVLNGLTQKPIYNLKTDTLYRQINPDVFFKQMGITFHHVEQNMTNDGYLLFSSVDEKETAAFVIDGATVAGHKMFQVEFIEGDDLRLFYQLIYWQETPVDTKFMLFGKEYNFYDYFEKVVVRTGEHIQKGYLYNASVKGRKIMNFQIFSLVKKYFSIE